MSEPKTGKKKKFREWLKNEPMVLVGNCLYCNDDIYHMYGFVSIPKSTEPGFLVCFNCVDKATAANADLEFV